MTKELSNESLAEEQFLNHVRNHKDTVFRMLFLEKKEFLSLFNAVNGTESI